MSATDTRTQIIAAARTLFAERTFDSVTIRDIACAVGLSPAMVMKCGGSKDQLFAEAMTFARDELPADVPRDRLGETLVRRIVERRVEGAAEPLVRAVFIGTTKPDAAGEAQQFIQEQVAAVRRMLGCGAGSKATAELVVCALYGLGSGMTNLHIAAPDRLGAERIIKEYGALVQGLIDQQTAAEAGS